MKKQYQSWFHLLQKTSQIILLRKCIYGTRKENITLGACRLESAAKMIMSMKNIIPVISLLLFFDKDNIFEFLKH